MYKTSWKEKKKRNHALRTSLQNSVQKKLRLPTPEDSQVVIQPWTSLNIKVHNSILDPLKTENKERMKEMADELEEMTELYSKSCA